MSKRKRTEDAHTIHMCFYFIWLVLFYAQLHFLMFWYVTLEKSFSMLKTEFANDHPTVCFYCSLRIITNMQEKGQINVCATPLSASKGEVSIDHKKETIIIIIKTILRVVVVESQKKCHTCSKNKQA